MNLYRSLVNSHHHLALFQKILMIPSFHLIYLSTPRRQLLSGTLCLTKRDLTQKPIWIYSRRQSSIGRIYHLTLCRLCITDVSPLFAATNYWVINHVYSSIIERPTSRIAQGWGPGVVPPSPFSRIDREAIPSR